MGPASTYHAQSQLDDCVGPEWRIGMLQLLALGGKHYVVGGNHGLSHRRPRIGVLLAVAS